MTRIAAPIQSRLGWFRPTADVSGRRFVALSRVLIIYLFLGFSDGWCGLSPAILLLSKAILLQSKKGVEMQNMRRIQVRRPDIALFECVPADVRPVPARHLKIAVEVISPSHVKTDRLEKLGEYAAAGIPWYWLVSVSDSEVTSIETFGLDHSVGHYRLARVLKPGTAFAVDLPIRIQLDWDQLTDLVL
ncbi:Uma2 family endonuclease [Nocardia amamiensis]|uniref:Uma2 family endonuclease n=1 Tax=Nocardia TaxID=1817 RepID=UPI0033D63CED